MSGRPLVRGPVARQVLLVGACDNAAPAVDVDTRALLRYETRQAARRAALAGETAPSSAREVAHA